MVTASPVFFLVKDLAKTEEATGTVYAILLSVGSVGTIIANFVGGLLADRIGRKRVITMGFSVLAPSLLAYSIAPSAFWVIAVYFVHMFSMALFQPAFTAFVADLSKVSSRGRAFGNYNLFWIGSTIPAPLVGGFLADAVGIRFPFSLAALTSLVAAAASFMLVETPRHEALVANKAGADQRETTMMPYVTVMLIFGVMSLLTGVLNGMLGPLIRLYCVYKLGVTATELGLVYSLGSGLVTTIVQIPGGRLTDTVGRKPLMLLSVLGVPFLITMAFTSSVPEFILVTAGLVAFGNLAAPAYYAWLMDLVSSGKRARASGLTNAITGVGLFFGAPLLTWIYESQFNIVVSFVATSIPWIVQVPLILKLKETKETKQPN
jgi:DHA1 family multidrug resistance protein-like MFS transporter